MLQSTDERIPVGHAVPAIGTRIEVEFEEAGEPVQYVVYTGRVTRHVGSSAFKTIYDKDDGIVELTIGVNRYRQFAYAYRTFAASLEALRNFLRTHGGEYPQAKSTDSVERTLSAWVTLQRHVRRGNHKRGVMTEKRAALLEGLPGWLWDGRYKANKEGEEKEEEEEGEQQKEEERSAWYIKFVASVEVLRKFLRTNGGQYPRARSFRAQVECMGEARAAPAPRQP